MSDYKKFLPLIICLSVFAIYAAYPTVNYYWDGIIFSQFVEDVPGFGAHLLHPNHLLYNWLGYAVYRAAHLFGIQTRALFAFQATTIVFGALCALMFFLIARTAFRSNYLSVVLTAIFSFSAAWWGFATNADVYVISIFFLLVVFYLILPERLPRPILVAVAHALAMFFHELAIFFFPVVALGLFFQTATLDGRKRASIIAEYCCVAALITAFVFCLSFYILNGEFDLARFIAWLTYYAQSAGFQPSFAESLQFNVRGHRQLFIDGSANLFQRGIINYVLLIVFITAALIFFVRCGRFWRDAKFFFKNFSARKFFAEPLVLMCAAWIVPYLIFLFFFMPENLFYRLFYFPAVILLLGVVFSAFERSTPIRRGRLALFAVLFSLYNFLFYIQPNAVIRPDTPLAAALQANAIWSSETIIFYESVHTNDMHQTINRLFKYFNPTVAWQPLDSITLEEFENKAAQISARGGKVWMDSQAFRRLSADSQSARWLADNLSNATDSKIIVPRYDIKYVEIIPKTFGQTLRHFNSENARF